jgi:hypothetical protein
MQRLNGGVEALCYLGIRSRTTLRKWRTLGLPVHQTPTGRVFAVCAELDAWRRPAGLRKGAMREHRGGQTVDSLSEFVRCLRDARTAQR